MDDPIYLDYAACSPVDPHVVETMMEWMVDRPGSHYAQNHVYGRAVADSIEESRRQIAGRIGAKVTRLFLPQARRKPIIWQ